MNDHKKTSGDRRGEAAPSKPKKASQPDAGRSWSPDQDLYGSNPVRDLDLDGKRYSSPPPRPKK